MRFSFDWVSFTIKPDMQRLHPFLINLGTVFRLLGIKDRSVRNSFTEVDLGAHRFYDHTYSFQGITLYVSNGALKGDIIGLSESDSERYFTYGINVEIKGSGCRYFEHLHDNDSDCWLKLFKALYGTVRTGAAVNICRVDFAFDDIIKHRELREAILDLDNISDAVYSKYGDSDSEITYVSSFRSVNEQCSVDRAKLYNPNTGQFEDYYAVGKTVYFGSFSSDTCCRFYDKHAEQHVKYRDDLLHLRDELGDIASWVRFEIVFRNEVAIKIINAYIRLSRKAFVHFLAKSINAYIRFIIPDDSNISRCSVVEWWSDFIGSVEHSRIKVEGCTKNELITALAWVARCSNTFGALIDNIGSDAFLTLILNTSNEEFYSARQRRIAGSDDMSDYVYSNLDVWRRNVPLIDYAAQ